MGHRRLFGLSQSLLTLLLAALVAAGAVVLLALAGGDAPRLGSSWELPWIALLAGFVLMEVGSVTLPRGRQTVDVSLTELPALVGLALFTPVELAAAGALAVLVTKPWLFRRAPERALFNCAVTAFELACAVVVFRAIVGPGAEPGPELWVGGLLAALVSAGVSAMLVNLAIKLVVGDMDLRSLIGTAALSVLPALVSSGFALVAVSVAWWDPRALVLLAPPLIAFFAQHRQVQEARVHYERMRKLYETSVRVRAARTVDEAVGELLVGALAMFGADVAAIVLPAGPDGEAVRLVDRGDGARREDTELQERLAHTMRAPMVEDGAVVGEVFVGRTETRRGFRDADRRSLATLVEHAGVTIERGRMQHRALHDPLTGLANRAQVSAVEPSGDLTGVIYADLDDFKAVNDSLGHATGDAVLRAVAGRLRGCVRGDDLPARLGGDEFAVVLAGLNDAGEASAVAERLLVALQRPYRIDGLELEVRASVGLAVARRGERTLEQLLGDADAAMYEAKAAGKGRVVFAG
jgi:diguanylate cyclase (GGDEF)-like protein